MPFGAYNPMLRPIRAFRRLRLRRRRMAGTSSSGPMATTRSTDGPCRSIRCSSTTPTSSPRTTWTTSCTSYSGHSSQATGQRERLALYPVVPPPQNQQIHYTCIAAPVPRLLKIIIICNSNNNSRECQAMSGTTMPTDVCRRVYYDTVDVCPVRESPFHPVGACRKYLMTAAD